MVNLLNLKKVKVFYGFLTRNLRYHGLIALERLAKKDDSTFL